MPKFIYPFFFPKFMARKRTTHTMRKMQPAVTDLYFKADTATNGDSRCYVDTAKELSKVNRRLYEQGKMYGYQGLTFIWKPNPANTVASIEVTVSTAGNTWSVHNSFVKAKALWEEMQDLVLDDNPSIKGKWRDFKVQLHAGQNTARTLGCVDASGNIVEEGEWEMSRFIMPQHDVDPATGEPLPALSRTALLIGDNSSSYPASGSRVSLLQSYEESRATVQPIDPNVPAEMSTSFFNLLTDQGSQEPELADIIEDENDQPPYAVDNYPGGDTNAPRGFVVQYGAISSAEVDGRVGPFVAPCGLIEINIKGYTATGAEVALEDMPVIDLLLHVAPGVYKGVAAVDMGQ